MHQLPHLYSRIKYESGVPPIGLKEPSSVRLAHRTARFRFRANLTHESKIPMSITVFLNEASV